MTVIITVLDRCFISHHKRRELEFLPYCRLSNGDCLQVHDRRASLFLDGLEEDGTPFDTQPLSTRLSDSAEDSAMWVGASSNGKYAKVTLELVCGDLLPCSWTFNTFCATRAESIPRAP